MRLEFFAASSAVDTDFTPKLLDVAPDGTAINLTEGILRARLLIDLWATSNVFRTGHRLRLEISSSNFPRFDRNLNTGELAGNSATLVTATNTIFHDKIRPSALILPVVP